ncbi:MAG TPA: MFS transporter [Dehalococcoidia bacterium]|nr:MFS transporter [Dehalococcoidia bacterium]
MSIRFPKIFYGWWIVAASFVIALFAGGGVFYGFTAIFEPIAREMGWSYTQISLAASLRGLEMGLLAPLVGVMTDRLGPRRMIFSGAILGALGLFLLGQTNSLGMFYIAFILVAVGMSTCTMTVLMTAVANWFRRRISIASGIAVCGFGFGGLMVPAMVSLIEAYDWRATMFLLALGMLLIPPTLSMVFRHQPEQYGYSPDGDTAALPPPVDIVAAGISQPDGANIGIKQALTSGAFWLVALTFTGHVFLVTAIVTHVMPYLSSVGVERSISGIVATAIPLTSILGRLSFGWFGDRFNRKLITVTGLTMMSLGLFCFGYIDHAGTWLLVPFLVLFGIGYGGLNVMRPALIQEYFGMRSFGTVFGLIIGINMVGSIGGPALAGWAFDIWGSYRNIWLLMMVVPVAAIVAMLIMKPVRSNQT